MQSPPDDNDPATIAEAEKLLDPRYFIESCLSLVDKDSRQVPFILNNCQRAYYERRTRRDIIVKSRKMGFSSVIDAIWLHACIFRENTRAVIVSHEEEATERLLRRVKYLIEHSAVPIRTKKNSVSEIGFPETESFLYIGTAGAKAFGRGDDITHAHLSEPAFYEDLAVVTGVQEALVRDAWFVMESTGNGAGTPFHQTWENANTDASNLSPFFFAWWMDPDNSIRGAQPFELNDTEKKLQRAFNLSWEQLAWRREKLKDMVDPRLFPQEYPATAEEAFLASGSMVFDWEAIKIQKDNADKPKWVAEIIDRGNEPVINPQEKGRLLVWKTPQHDGEYLIVGDASLGIVGKDLAVADVFDRRSGEQVAQWRGYIPANDFGEKVLFRLGALYNWAVIAQENNYPGNATVIKLLELKYPRLWMDPKHRAAKEPGFKTTEAVKAVMISEADAALRHLDVKVNSKYTLAELGTYVLHEDRSIGAQSGCHDDTITTLMGYVYVNKRLHLELEGAVTMNRGKMGIERYRAAHRATHRPPSSSQIV